MGTSTRNHLVPVGLASAALADWAMANPIVATTARGAFIHVLADFPVGVGPFATIILASGQSYHMAMPALDQTAKQMVAQAIAVYRFNWAYFSEDAKLGLPSDDLSRELEDLQTVIEIARNEPRVAQGQLAVGGKSLGSLVAWTALVADKSLRGGMFLTPICSRVPEGHTQAQDLSDENYPGLIQENRPLLFVAGDRDPLCAPHVLYAAAQKPGNARVAIVGGDHSFGNKALNGPAQDAALRRNVDLVARISAHFVSEKFGI